MIHVSTVTDRDEFYRMAGEWHEVLEQSAAASIFVTWEWQLSWWDTHNAGKSLRIVRVYDGDYLLGIVPLYQDKASLFGIPYLRLRFIGDGSYDSSYLDLIARSGCEERVVGALYDYLRENTDNWDVVELRELPQQSPHVKYLQRVLSGKKLYFLEKVLPASVVTLPDSWDIYLSSLSKKRRHYVRSLAKNLVKHGFTVQTCATPEDVPDRLSSLFDLHQKRWAVEGKPGSFACGLRRKFYQDMAVAFLKNGWLRFYSLSADGKFVAHQYGFEYGNRFYALQEGFDPDWIDRDVGNTLRARVMEDAIGRGVKLYDFCDGMSFHKKVWGSEILHNLHMMSTRATIKGFVLHYIPLLLYNGKLFLKRHLPRQVLQWRVNKIKRIKLKSWKQQQSTSGLDGSV